MQVNRIFNDLPIGMLFISGLLLKMIFIRAGKKFEWKIENPNDIRINGPSGNGWTIQNVMWWLKIENFTIIHINAYCNKSKMHLHIVWRLVENLCEKNYSSPPKNSLILFESFSFCPVRFKRKRFYANEMFFGNKIFLALK